MLQELNEELKQEIDQQFLSSLKNYLQFNFEGHTFILEYSSILWFSAKIMFLHEMVFPSASALYYLRDSPNFNLFLEQVNAFKVEVDLEKIRILSLVTLKGEINLKKTTFREDIQKFCTEHPQELREMINQSFNQYQVHYQKQLYLPAERELRKCLDNDKGFIFLEMGNLMIHGVSQLPGQKVQQKIMPKQVISPCFELYQVSEEIFGQLEKQENMNLDGIVNLISQFRYFTFYNQRFLLLHYTVLLREFIIEQEGSDERNSSSIKQKEINEDVVLSSALFAVTANNKHILLNVQEDAKCLFPQMELLLSKQQQELMKPEKFIEVFAHKIKHPKVNPQKEIQEISQLFQPGSVLIYKTSLFINRACVYLGNDLIITVVMEDDIQNNNDDPITDDARARMENEEIDRQGKILKFQQFDQFISEPTDIQEIRFSFQPYNKQELLDKALQMNQAHFDFNIYKQNSEHLAFQLATGFRYSPQQTRLVNKIGEAMIDLFGWKGKIHEEDI